MTDLNYLADSHVRNVQTSLRTNLEIAEHLLVRMRERGVMQDGEVVSPLARGCPLDEYVKAFTDGVVKAARMHGAATTARRLRAAQPGATNAEGGATPFQDPTATSLLARWERRATRRQAEVTGHTEQETT